MKKKITVPYFPAGLRYATPIIFGAAIYLAVGGYIAWSIPIILLGVIMLTTNYVTEIDLGEQRYDDYLSLLSIPVNAESKKFKSLDRIIITKGNYAQMINTRAQSRQLDWSDYTGTLISDTGTLDLLTRNSKKELLVRIKEFADFLKVGVEDRTSKNYYWIDLTKIEMKE